MGKRARQRDTQRVSNDRWLRGGGGGSAGARGQFSEH